jgi:hypothetical protein
MIEKTEWEIVDVPHAENRHAPDGRKSLLQMMQALLGPWWRWKLAALVTLAVLALVFFVAAIGVLLIVGTGAALLGLGAGKLRQWWLQHKAGHTLQRTDTGEP